MIVPQLKCTCPDFSGIQLANPSARSISRQIPRVWDSSQVTRNGQCKHIFAVLRQLESDGAIAKQPIPNDYPTPPTPKYSEPFNKPRLHKNSRMGDSFR